MIDITYDHFKGFLECLASGHKQTDIMVELRIGQLHYKRLCFVLRRVLGVGKLPPLGKAAVCPYRHLISQKPIAGMYQVINPKVVKYLESLIRV